MATSLYRSPNAGHSCAVIHYVIRVVLVTAVWRSKNQLVEAAATATPAACHGSTPAFNVCPSEAEEQCTLHGRSTSPLCICIDGILRHCSSLCQGEDQSDLCLRSCTGFSELDGIPCVPPVAIGAGTIVGTVAAVVIPLGLVAFVIGTFLKYRKYVKTTGGTMSIRGYVRSLRCAADEVTSCPVEPVNMFSARPSDANTLENSDSVMAPLRSEMAGESSDTMP